MKFLRYAVASSSLLLITQVASAEVSLGTVQGWEAYTTGRVNAFLTYGTGDGFPVAPASAPDRTFIPGGGLPTTKDRIPELDGMDMPIATDPGHFSKWRVRSGYLPNILGLGVRSQASPELKLTGFVALWGTIESEGARKYFPVQADFREAFFRMEGSWGSVTGGRTLSLFSRGITEVEMLYGHGYGVGFHPSIGDVGPTGGLIGFGVLSAAYNPGVYYTTPSLGGLSVSLGVYDPIRFAASWDRSNTPRPEAELAYDMTQGNFKLHVFASGAFQKLYKDNNDKDAETLWGAGGGLRLEFGPIHIGGGGHYGRGVGMFYAFDETGAGTNAGGVATLVGPAPANHPVTMVKLNEPNELRTFDGFSGFVQYAHERFDINLGAGQSRAHTLEIDKVLPASLIKTQTGISAGFVYHVSKNLHVNVDYMRAMFRWYKGDKQDANFINAGAVINW